MSAARVPMQSDGTPSRVWMQNDGEPVSCREKLEVLEENYEELRHVMQDAFDDAVIIGVDEAVVKQAFAELLASLESPKR